MLLETLVGHALRGKFVWNTIDSFASTYLRNLILGVFGVSPPSNQLMEDLLDKHRGNSAMFDRNSRAHRARVVCFATGHQARLCVSFTGLLLCPRDSLMKRFYKIRAVCLLDTIVGHLCGTLLRDTLDGKTRRTRRVEHTLAPLLWKTLVGSYRGLAKPHGTATSQTYSGHSTD